MSENRMQTWKLAATLSLLCLPPTAAFVLHKPQATPTTIHSCQLLGMNCATPTDFQFSFQGFCQRGGVTDVHADGWGLIFYDGKGTRAFHDVEAASTSPIAKFLGQYDIKTLNMMAHIRYATQGQVDLANVHPFQREMWGIQFSFCHNGDVPMFSGLDGSVLPSLGKKSSEGSLDQVYFPIGSTDSEAVFCAILNALRTKFRTLPSLPVLHETLQKLCEEVVNYSPNSTILNFLLACGPHTLWVYSWPGARPGSNVWNGLSYTIREWPFRKCQLQDLDYEVDFSQVTRRNDRVAVIATKPLTTDEEWVELNPGELILFDEGLPHNLPEECFEVELNGHGLASKVLAPPRLEEDMRRYNSRNAHFAGGGI